MSGNFAIKGGGAGRLMANAILNFHFDFLNPSLSIIQHMVYFSTLCVKRFKIENLLVGNSVWLEPLMLNWWRRLSLGAACN